MKTRINFVFALYFSLMSVAYAELNTDAMSMYDAAIIEKKWGQAVSYFNKEDVPNSVKLLNELGLVYNVAKAANVLGVLYLDGQVVPKDYERAKEWLERASTLGSAIAEYNLGVLYQNGQSNVLGKSEYDQAFKWYKKSSDKSFVLAYVALAKCYYFGFGVAKDIHQAFNWFLKAAENGDEESMPIVAYLYSRNYSSKLPRPLAWLLLLFGVDQGKNREAAFYWMQRSAIRNNPVAQYNIAIMYQYGIGARKNEELTFQYLKNSADQKYPLAMQKLKKMKAQ
ncbi:MAG: tetratricopeptide repeat protein [Methylacidiphilales bacterium]|nr:tetratricopeptide repeat protein [Candidatus Methylacidiphilales bacterium]